MKKNGFTLIELLVVIGISSLLSSILIGYSHTGEKYIVFFREEAKITGAIFQAKSLSVSSYGEPGKNSCGYGIHLEEDAPNKQQKVIVFSDMPVGQDCSKANQKYDNKEEISQEAIILDNTKLRISGLTDFVFIPPDPTVFPQKDVNIKLTLTDYSKCETITVTRAGQISVNTEQTCQ